jgi:hypothetical protein
MHIIKEKRFLGQRANKEEIRLIVLRQSLIKANSLGEKHDIGENIKALKEGLVASGRYKRFEGEIYNAPF